MKKVALTIGILLLFSTAGFAIKNQAALLGQLDFKFKGYEVKSLSLQKITVELTIMVSNKSTISFDINGYDLQIMANKKPLARLSSATHQVVPALGSANIRLTVAAAPSQLLGTAVSSDILSAITGDKSKILIGISGTVSGKIANAIGVKNFPININSALTDLLPKSVF